MAKKGLALLAALTIPAALCLADDGSWSTAFRLSEGALYSETENPSIALESELLVFDGFDSGSTRASFFFHNTGNRDVTVAAGFPVRMRIGVSEDTVPGTKETTGLFLAEGKYEKEPGGLAYAKQVFGDALRTATLPEGEETDHSEYYVLPKDLPPRIELPSDAAAGLFAFSITQDGAPVTLGSVVQEVTRYTDPNEGAMLEITFHFRHSLAVKAGAQTRVDVSYKGDYHSGSENGGISFIDQYSYTYVLGTGRTWKGPIGKLYLAVPAGVDASLPKPFLRMGRLRGKDVYLASGYEPGAKDEIDISEGRRAQPSPGYFQSIWFDSPQETDQPSKPAQDFVTVKGASSSLKDTSPVYTTEGVIRKATFGPAALFDGVRETAWAEGVAGDGIGEWVEFTLAKDVEAVDVQNGFNMSFVGLPGTAIDSYYEKNSRPKALEFVSSDGKHSVTLGLADTKDLQSFDRFFLSRGTWRMYVRAVYKGTKYQDTCLGELTFLPASPLYQQFAADAFLKAHEADVAGE